MPNHWTPEQTALIRQMVKEMASASEMAAAIGGVTRCAVIGHMRRHGIASARAPGDKRTKPERSAKPRSQRARQISQATAVPPPPTRESPPVLTPHAHAEPRAQPRPTEPPPPPTAGATTFFCLTEHACRFPLWGEDEPAEHLFCGEPTDDGRPYCAVHWKTTHQEAHVRARPPYVRAA